MARNGTTAEVTADEVTVLDSPEECDQFVELEIELRDDSPDGLDEIADELVSAGAEQGHGLPKLFRALGRLSAYGRCLLVRSRSCGAACASSCARSSGMTRHTSRPRSQSLHDMRVGVRRLRALLRAGW